LPAKSIHVVTGAFGFSGKYIARRLLEKGCAVRTLTSSPDRANPFAGAVTAFPFRFDQPQEMARSMQGAEVLYNTYWVRFNRGEFDQTQAVSNTNKLIEAARQAGLRRIVHVSITNPSLDSPLQYFRGKAELEEAVKRCGLSFAILRPAVLFGHGGILVNNIAWILRRFPLFGIFGDGQYRLQPIYVDDFAALAVAAGQRTSNEIVDAIGPQTFTYRELVSQIGICIGKRRPFVPIPDWFGLAVAWLIGRLRNDVVLTGPEIAGLRAGLLCTDSPPVGETRLTDWAAQNADQLGRRYASELARRRDKRSAIENL
jgi:uncharacterized protein YbjT (DUF2867 family)